MSQGHSFKPDLQELAFQLKLTRSKVAKRAFVSTGTPADKAKVLPAIGDLARHNVQIFATEGTSKFLSEHGVPNTLVNKISEGISPSAATLLHAGEIDLVVNILTGDHDHDEKVDCKHIRSLAIEHNIPLITEADVAIEMIQRLVREIQRPTATDTDDWNMERNFRRLVHERGGWANYHAHLDKAYLITPEYLALAQVDMQEKWEIYKTLKEGYTPEDLETRISRGVESMIKQGVTHFRTLIDADSTIKMMGVDAALAVQARYRDKINFEIGTQPLEGVLDPEARKFFERACEKVDVIGGLPSKDRPQPEKHFEIILGIARDQGKRLDVHVDQENNPDEHETELLALKTIEYGMEGRVSAIHSISLAAQSPSEQDRVIGLLKDAGISVIVCPSAALSMEHKFPSYVTPHNSIAPVMKLVEAGVQVVLGTDNINDFFMPMVDGDMWVETRMLMESVRCYNLARIADIACDNSLFEEQLAKAA